jgi:hypothetical protein
MTSVTVTVSPIAGRQVPQNLYRVAVDTLEPTPALIPGEYKTIDAVLKSFSWPLKVTLKIAVVEALTNNRTITFKLENPHDLEVL